MKKAYSYKRWSTKSQTDKDSSIRQTATANQWMQEYGTALGYSLSNEVFTDAGKSAHKGKHIAKDENGIAKGELARFIQSVETGKIASDSILLIDEISRFSRLPLSEAVPLFMSVINSGIGLVFTGGYDKRIITANLINNDSYLLPSIVTDLFRSNRESEEKGRKIKMAKQTMLKEIKTGIVYRNNLPKFFTFVPDVPSNPKCRTGKYVHNKLTKILQELIEMFLAGKAMYSIATEFNKRGVRTFKDREWSGNGINKILRNRILMGEYKGVKNYVEPVISESDFNKIQTILNRNTYNKGKKGELINIFRGVCFCAVCNSAMSIMSTAFKGAKYTYLRCGSLTRGKIGCTNRSSISLPEVELEFFYNFMCKNPKQLINKTESKELKQLRDLITTNQVQLDSLNKKIATLVSLEDVGDVSELKTQLARFVSERDAVKTTLDELNLKVSSVVDAPDTYKLLQDLFNASKSTVTEFDVDGTRITDKILIGRDLARHDELVAQEKSTIVSTLQDNYTREGIRIMLPPLIGKITVDSMKGQFYIYNRMGKMIFESTPRVRKYNSSDKWVKGVQDYWAKKKGNAETKK